GSAAGDMGRHRGRMVPCEPLAAAPRPVDRVDHRPGRGFQHCDDGAVAARRERVTAAAAGVPAGTSAGPSAGRAAARSPAPSPAFNPAPRTPMMTRPAPHSSPGETVSPRKTNAALIPTTGTSIENGATTPAGLRDISQDQMPEPRIVAITTV